MNQYVQYVGTHPYDRQPHGGTYTKTLTVSWLVLNGRTVNGFISFSF